MRALLLFLLVPLFACAGSATPSPEPGPDGGPGWALDTCDDGLDQDRDGLVDEACPCGFGAEQRCFRGDPSQAGVGVCTWGNQRCASDGEYGVWDLCEGDGFPSLDDECNGVDDDCDGTIDEGCACVSGETRPCYDGPSGTDGVGACTGGVATCYGTGGSTMWDGCVGAVEPSMERCGGGGDEDCDGRIDEGCSCTVGETQPCYSGPIATRNVGVCRGGEQTCVADGAGTSWTGCIGEVRPTSELCSGGFDEDCDGLTDCADPDCTASCCSTYSETLPVVPAEGEILFIVDRSGSMQWPAVGTTRSRWDELTSAMSSVVPMVSTLPLGLLTFPRRDGTDERLNCAVASSLDVGVASGTGSTILSTLTGAAPRAGDTPTPDAFATARSVLSSSGSSRPRFVILATDGLPEPNCGATVAATVSAISALRSSLGVDTFVIGIVGPDSSGSTAGIPALQDGLNQMADAGGRPRAGTLRYYEAVDARSLTAALRTVIASATDCRFTLSRTPPRPAHTEVRFGSTLVPTSGYTLSGTSLTMLGAYCDQIRAGLVSSVTVSDSCAP